MLHVEGLYAETLPSRARMVHAANGDDYPDEIAHGAVARLLKRRDDARRLIDLFGHPTYMYTTTLPQVDGQPTLGPLYGEDGQELRWTLWAPHRRALIDVFRRGLPSRFDMELRANFATRHSIRYAAVQPGWVVTFDDIRLWLEKTNGAPLTAHTGDSHHG